MEIILSNYQKLLTRVQKQIQQTESSIIKSMTRQKVVMSWEIGREINKHLLGHGTSEYGDKLIDQLSQDTLIDKTVLYKMRNFHNSYPALPNDDDLLNWSHYRILIGVKDQDKRQYLENLTKENSWDTKTLASKIKRLKSDKKAKDKTITNVANKPLKLTPIRGALFTYPLIKVLDLEGVFIDCGFSIFKDVKTDIAAGTTIKSVKNPKDETYSFAEIDVNHKKLNIYKAYLERVVDGDTIRVILDLGFGILHHEILRLKGINAPELKTEAGKKSAKILDKILKDASFLIIKTIKVDIYGRFVADVYFDETKNESSDPQEVANSGVYLNQLLLDKGTAELF